MFSIDLTALERERKVAVEATFAPDEGMWDETGLTFAAPIRAQASAKLLPSGQILVDGRLEGTLETACRRCLTEGTVDFLREFATMFVTATEAEMDQGGDEIREIPNGVAALDLGPVVREELMLNLPKYTVCRDECAGMCARCGKDLNSESCTCPTTEPDPRWDALRAVTL